VFGSILYLFNYNHDVRRFALRIIIIIYTSSPHG